MAMSSGSGSGFEEEGRRTGVRFSWNVWPTSRIAASRITAPFGAMYTPLSHASSEVACAPYEPLCCTQCEAIVNPHCRVNFDRKTWLCNFCHHSNNFPQHYGGMSESCLPAELFPGNEVLEYQIPQRTSVVPTFLFVVDTVLEEADLRAAVVALQHSLELLPQYARVGLVTYGEMVQVYELGFELCKRHYLLRGEKAHTKDDVTRMLDLGVKQLQREANGAAHNGMANPALSGPSPADRFFPRVSDCEFNLAQIVDDIVTDGQEKRRGHRPLRCTGAAMAVAVALAEVCMPKGGCKVCLFAGGACTHGPGKIVDTDLSCHYRTHHDFEKNAGGAIQRFTKSALHFSELGSRLVISGNSCDLFACSLDQTGAAEMYSMMEQTGGTIVLSESFEHHVFRESLKRCFRRKEGSDDLEAALNVEIEVKCSKEVKVCGLIGPALGMGKDTGATSEVEIGEARTVRWKSGSCGRGTTFGIYFDIQMQHTDSKSEGQQQLQGAGRVFYTQFVTEYTHSLGQRAKRVVTVARRWAPPDSPEIARGFDEEAAAVLMARMAGARVEEGQEVVDTIRWLDRMLVSLCSRYGDCNENSSSHQFHLPQNFQRYPQLMYHLRRSQVLQVFNNSPDETVFFRLALKKESTRNSLLILQPRLLSYSFDSEGRPLPVPLDATSVLPDRILLLDTFFCILVHNGTTIAQWRREGYQDKEEYAGFRQMLENPPRDAKAMASGRLPYPNIRECDQNGSQAR